MAKDFMDTQTGGTSEFETNTDIQSSETKLPSSYAASSIQKVVSQENQQQPVPQVQPQVDSEPAAPIPLEQAEEEPTAPKINPSLLTLDKIAKNEGIEMNLEEEEDLDLDVEIPKQKYEEPSFISNGTSDEYIPEPLIDDPISVDDVDEESELRPTLKDGTPIEGEVQAAKAEAEQFNLENADKGLKSTISGKIVFDDEIPTDELKSVEGIDPIDFKKAGYYEMPNRSGRYLKDENGNWFKIYTSSRTGRRVKRRMGGLRAASLEDNAEQIASIDSQIKNLWDVSKPIGKKKTDAELDSFEKDFVYSQEVDGLTIDRFRNFSYDQDEISNLRSRLSKRKEHKGKDLNDPKQLSRILKSAGSYKYAGKEYLKDNGKWYFKNKKGEISEAKRNITSIELNAEPVVNKETITKKFDSIVDFFGDKFQDFANSFSEALNTGLNALVDYNTWSISEGRTTITEIVNSTLKGDPNLSITKNFDDLTSEEMVRASIEILDNYGNVAREKMGQYAKDWSLSVEALFRDNPYRYDAMMREIVGISNLGNPQLISDEQGKEPISISSQTFDPTLYLLNSKQGREKLMAMGYLSKYGGFQAPKTQGLYSVGDVTAYKSANNEWSLIDGTPISDPKQIAALESAGSSLTKENALFNLSEFAGKPANRIPKYVMDGQAVDLRKDTEIGKILNSDDALRNFILTRDYISDSSTAIARFLNPEYGGNPYGTSKVMGETNILITDKEATELAYKMAQSVKEYNEFLSAKEGIDNFIKTDVTNLEFSEAQKDMIIKTKQEAVNRLRMDPSQANYYDAVQEVYTGARNMIENMYSANRKLEEIDNSGMTIDAYMYANKKRVIPTLSNIGNSIQATQASELYNINSKMVDLVISSQADGKIDVDQDGKITFTDRISPYEKAVLESKLSSYQDQIDRFKSETTSKNLDEVSKLRSKLENIPVMQERIFKRLQDLDPSTMDYVDATSALSILDNLEKVYSGKLNNINQATDAVLATNPKKMAQEVSEYKWVAQHLASIPMGEQFSAKNRFDMLYESINNRRLQLEQKLDITPTSQAIDEFRSMFNKYIGGKVFSAEEIEYYESLYTLRSLAPLYLNNDHSINEDGPGVRSTVASFMSSIYKSFIPEFLVRSKGSVGFLDTETQEGYARTVSGTLKEMGISSNDFRDARKQVQLEKFGQKDIGLSDPRFYGDAAGSAFALVAMITGGTQAIKGVYKTANAITKMGRGSESIGFLESAVTYGSNAYVNVMKSNVITRALVTPIEFGVTFKAGALPFNEQAQEHMTFTGGFLGGAFSQVINKGIPAFSSALGVNKYLYEVFGDKYGHVVKLLKSKQAYGHSTGVAFGLGLGETAKEIGEELTLAWQDSKNGRSAWKVIEDNYGTFDKSMKFIVSSLMMGIGFGFGSNLGKAQKVYETLSPEKRKMVDDVTRSMVETSERAIRASEDVIQAEMERYSKGYSAEVIEEQKRRKDDSKDESRLPSEERKGEEPIEEKPIEETGKEETSPDRVLQEEQVENRQEAKEQTEKEIEDIEMEAAPSEVQSERLSLSLNESKSSEMNRDIYEIYDEGGKNVGEMTVGTTINGESIVEQISIKPGSQKKGYAKEAVEAFNNEIDSNVSVSTSNANTKVVAESLAKQENAEFNDRGDVEILSDKKAVEETEGMTTAQKIANTLRELKINDNFSGQTFGSTLPFHKAYNAAIESAAKVIEKGGSKAKALAKARNNYRASNFFKSLETQKEKIAEEAKFIEAVAEQLKAKNVDFQKSFETIEKNFQKIAEKFEKTDIYKKSKNKKALLEDLKKDYEKKVASKVKQSKDEAKMSREALERSSKEGRFQAEYEGAISEAIKDLSVNNPKQIQLAAARARVMRSEKYQRMSKEDQAKYLEEATNKLARGAKTRSDYANKFMEKAVEKAVENYTKSEFYQEAAPESQAKIIEDFRNGARRMIEESIESQMTPEQRTEIARSVRDFDPEAVKADKADSSFGRRQVEAAGKSKIEYKLTLSEMLRDKAKFIKDGAKHMSMIKDSIAEYMRLNMPKGKYSKTELSYLLNLVKKAKTQGDITKAFEKVDEAIDKKIGKELDSLRAQAKKKYLGDGLKKQIFKKTKSGRLEAKISSPGRKKIYEFIENNVNETVIDSMSLSELKELTETLDKMIKTERSETIKAEKIINLSRRTIKAEIIEAANENFKIRENGVTDLKSLLKHLEKDGSYAIIDGVYYSKTDVNNMISGKVNEFKQTEEYKNIKGKEAQEEAVQNFIEENPALDIFGSDISAYHRISDRGRRGRVDVSQRNLVERAGYSISGSLGFNNMDFFGEIRSFAKNNQPMWNYIGSRIVEPLKDAYVFSEKQNREIKDAREKALTKIFGKGFEDTFFGGTVGKFVYGKPEKTVKELSEIPTDLRAEGTGEIILDPYQDTVRDMEAPGSKTRASTNDQLINAYLLGKNPITRSRMELQGYDYAAVEEYINRPENSKLRDYAQWLEDFYNKDARASYEDTYSKVTKGDKFEDGYYYPQEGVSKASPESELYIDPEFLTEGFTDFSRVFISPESLIASSAKQRVDSGKLNLNRSASEVYLNYNSSMIRMKNYYDIAKDMSLLMNDKNIRDIMEQVQGDKRFKMTKDHFTSIITGKTAKPRAIYSKAVNTFAGASVFTTLWGKSANLMKQFSSFTHFWNAGIKYGLHGNNVIGATVRPIAAGGTLNPFAMLSGGPRVGLAKNTTPKEDYAFVEKILTSAFVRNRYRGGLTELEVDVKRAMEAGAKFEFLTPKQKKNLSNTLMFYTRAGDMAGVLLGPGGGLSFATNLYRMYRGQGKSIEEAAELAERNFVVEATSAQQTTNQIYRSQFQQSDLARMIGMYKTSQMAASKKVLNAVQSLSSGVEISNTEKAQAISDLLYYSLFASAGFTAVSTGMIYLATGDVPFSADDEDQNPEKWQEASDRSYTKEEQQEVFDNVRNVITYEAAMDNVQAIAQGYGVPGFFVDRILNQARGRSFYNEIPLLKFLDGMVEGGVDLFEGGRGEITEEDKKFYEQYTGKEYVSLNESESTISKFLDLINTKSQADQLVRLYDAIVDEGIFSKEFVFAFQNWPENAVKQMAQSNRSDVIFKRMTGTFTEQEREIYDVRPQSVFDRANQIKRNSLQKNKEEQYAKRATEYKTVDIVGYASETKKDRLNAFTNYLKTNRDEYIGPIIDFYNNNLDLRKEMDQLDLD